MSDKPAIELRADSLTLNFERPEFADLIISGLVATPTSSDAGTVRISQWPEARIEKWRRRAALYDRFGRHVARLIRTANRPVHGDGLVQQVARRIGVPLRVPPKGSSIVADCRLQHATASITGQDSLRYSA